MPVFINLHMYVGLSTYVYNQVRGRETEWEGEREKRLICFDSEVRKGCSNTEPCTAL